MDARTVLAPAKLNLSLQVLGKRLDGYHDLRMVMVPLSFGDTIELCPPAHAGEITLTQEIDPALPYGQAAALPIDERHLCFRAAKLLSEVADRRHGVHIHLRKCIPVGAGLGGGSSDAAAVLRGLNAWWQLGWSPNQLAELGLRLGADVPFFCYDGPALVEGVGERVKQYPTFPLVWVLLVNPGIAVATAEVYQRLGFGLTPQQVNARRLPLFFEQFEDVTSILANDLEPVTQQLVPVIHEIKSRLVAAGAVAALMSGSGPTVFGVFRTREDRDRARAQLTDAGWWLCATQVEAVL